VCKPCNHGDMSNPLGGPGRDTEPSEDRIAIEVVTPTDEAGEADRVSWPVGPSPVESDGDGLVERSLADRQDGLSSMGPRSSTPARPSSEPGAAPPHQFLMRTSRSDPGITRDPRDDPGITRDPWDDMSFPSRRLSPGYPVDDAEHGATGALRKVDEFLLKVGQDLLGVQQERHRLRENDPDNSLDPFQRERERLESEREQLEAVRQDLGIVTVALKDPREKLKQGAEWLDQGKYFEPYEKILAAWREAPKSAFLEEGKRLLDSRREIPQRDSPAVGGSVLDPTRAESGELPNEGSGGAPSLSYVREPLPPDQRPSIWQVLEPTPESQVSPQRVADGVTVDQLPAQSPQHRGPAIESLHEPSPRRSGAQPESRAQQRDDVPARRAQVLEDLQRAAEHTNSECSLSDGRDFCS
jgi:hypothetical protein